MNARVTNLVLHNVVLYTCMEQRLCVQFRLCIRQSCKFRSHCIQYKLQCMYMLYINNMLYIQTIQRTFYTSYQIHLYSSFPCDDNNAATKLCKSLIAKTASTTSAALFISVTFIRAIYKNDSSIAI